MVKFIMCLCCILSMLVVSYRFLIEFKYIGGYVFSKLINKEFSNAFIKTRKANRINKNLKKYKKSHGTKYKAYSYVNGSIHEEIISTKGSQKHAEFLYSVFVEDNTKSEVIRKLKKQLGFVSTISVRRSKKVEFIVCNIGDDNFSFRSSYNSLYIDFNLDRLISIINELLDGNQYGMEFDYSEFFKSLKDNNSVIYSLFSSIVDSEELDNITSSEKMKNDVSNFLYYQYSNPYSLKDIESEVKNSEDIFFKSIRGGIYILDKSKYYLNNLYFSINLMRYILNPDKFERFEDLFKDYDTFHCSEDNTYAIIFDKDVFSEKLVFRFKKENYNVYTHSLLNNNVFEIDDFENYEEDLKKLLESNIFEYKVLKDINNPDSIYFISKKSNAVSLKTAITKFSEDEFIELLQNLISFFFSDNNTNDTLRKLYIDDKKSPLLYLKVNKKNKKIMLTEFYRFHMEGTLCLDSIEVLFESIILFLQNNFADYLTHIDRIYDLNFVKLLPPALVTQLKLYIKGEVFDEEVAINSFNKFKAVPAKEIANIDFIEDINLNAKNYINTISFFEFIPEQVECAVNTLISLRNCNTDIKDSKFIVCKAKSQLLNDVVKVYSTNIESLDHIKGHLYFPEKLICSKDVYTDEGYIVLGVKYNLCGIANITDVTYTLLDNDKNILKLIRNIMDIKYNLGIGISNIKNIFINDQLDIFFGFENGMINDIDFSSSEKYKYYKNLLKAFQKNIKDERIFDIAKKDVGNIADKLSSRYFKLSWCYEHKLWHLSNMMCKMCEKVYTIIPHNYSSSDKLYEDSISIYYKFKDGNIIKAYIEHNVKHKYIYYIRKYIENDKEIQNNLSAITASGQIELLTPKSIAIHSNKNYVGVLCDEFDFENIMDMKNVNNMSRLKFILILYKNLLSLIQDGKFISKDERIYSTIFMHKLYKGKIFIPNIELLDFETILLSTEKSQAIQSEKEKFSKFLIEYLESDSHNLIEDENFEKVIDDIKNLNFSDEVIKEYINMNSNYCETHAYYFSNNDNMCLNCQKELGNKVPIRYIDKKEADNIINVKPKFEGGEAKLFEYGGVGKLFKCFDSKFSTYKLKAKLIGKIFDKKDILEAYHEKNPFVKFIIVEEVIMQKSGNRFKLLGYLQELLTGTDKLSMLNDIDFIKEKGFTRKDVIEILIHVSEGIEFLHSCDIFIGDLNGGNILFDTNKNVYFIDFDGMSVEDVKTCTYTEEYIYPPSAKNLSFSKDDDWYSLAIQAFHCLTYAHPFNRSLGGIEGLLERMEKGISILGDHGLPGTSVYIGCDFMSKELRRYFLETFESSRRESILPVLKEYYLSLCQQPVFRKVDNDKTIFFDRDTTNNLFIEGINVCSFSELNGFGISGDDSIILFGDDKTILVDTENKEVKLVYNEGLRTRKDEKDVLVSSTSNALYFVRDRTKLLKVTADLDEPKVIFSKKEKEILAFEVVGDEKFVILLESGEIYCNNILLCTIYEPEELEDDEIVNYIVEYDAKTKRWLVICQYTNNAYFVVINPDGNYSQFIIEDISLGYSRSFYGNVLYYISDKKICCLSIKKKEVSNIIECDIVSTNSIIKRVGNKFIIYNEDGVYEYVKQ